MADVGRPTDYSPEIIDKTIAYIEKCEEDKDLPSVAGLAVYLNCARRTIYNWGDENPEFLHILEKLLATQEVKLINGGLKGTYNSTISKLILTKHGYADKVESDLTSNGKDISIPPITWVDTKPDETKQ